MGSALQAIIGNTSGIGLHSDVIAEVGSYKWGFVGANTDDGYYEPRIISISDIKRVADPIKKTFDVGRITIVLDNKDPNQQENYITTVAIAGDLKLQTCIIKLLLPEEDSEFILYSGIISDVKGSADKITLQVTPKVFNDLGTIQKMISRQRFPDVQERYIGVGVPVTIGDYQTADVNGWIELPIIDETNRYLAASQVVPVSSTVFPVYYLPEAGGGDPTQITPDIAGVSAVDDYGDTYLRYQVPVGSWDSTRKYITPKLPPKTGSSVSQIMDDLQELIVNQSLNLTDDDLDSFKWSDAELFLNAYYGSIAIPYAGMSIPESGAPSIEANESITSGWGIIQKLAAMLGLSLYITAEGKIAVTVIAPFELLAFDTSLPIEVADPVYRFSREDQTIMQITFDNNKWNIFTDVRASSSRPVLGGPAGTAQSERYQNADGIPKYGAKKIKEFVQPGVNLYGSQVAVGLTSGRVNGLWNTYLTSGAYTQYLISTRGMEGLIPDVGDRIVVDDPLMGLSEATMLVIGVAYKVKELSAQIACINVSEPFGADNIIITSGGAGQSVLQLFPTQDTWIETANPTTAHGAATTLKSGFNIGGIDGDAERAMSRFEPLASILDDTNIIWSAKLVLESNGGNNDRGGFAQGGIWQIIDDTWGDLSTWDNFLNNGAGSGWDEKGAGSLIDTKYGKTPNMKVVGPREITLNSDALIALNTILQDDSGVFDVAYFAGLIYPNDNPDADTNEYYDFDSSEGTVPPYLELVYS